MDSAFCLVELENGWQINDIEPVSDFSYKRSGGDPYLIFPKLEEPINTISGIRFMIHFDPMISKPFLAELFWKPQDGGFSEEDKIFFILHPGKGNILDFIVPISRDVGYDQIRLDLPRDLNVVFSIKGYEIVKLNSNDTKSQQIEAYSMLSSSEAEELDILIPYLIHTLQHGIKRLTGDPFFCFFWLSLILVTLFGIRKVTRKISNSKA